MPDFESIPDQKIPSHILNTLLRKGAIPHALLFLGMEGVGKQAAAKRFAMACNCLANSADMPYLPSDKDGVLHNLNNKIPCGVCVSCRKILSKNHPDIIEIKPSGSFIKIAQIRDLREILALKPYEAKIRVVIISDVQVMNAAAGNAILKVLEEPPEKTVLILTATEQSDIIPTIASRCQFVRFNPVSQKRLAEMLVEEKGLPPDSAAILAAMANGSFSRALDIVGIAGLRKRDWIINETESLSLNETGKCLVFAEKLSKDKENFLEFLEILKIWYRDIIVFKSHPEKIIFFDLLGKIQNASNRHTKPDLLSRFDAIESCRQNVRANVNLRLTAETLLLRFAQNQ
ncbi:MAG: DNA polymerase III subunit delta' [Desulfobacterium sp.]|nr:DNA polymerase III subunit delta' [Desulfobacterium sp.]MBU3948541.1 DNA polymerase III subunit delta' [Pseudomonadota bacterium]